MRYLFYLFNLLTFVNHTKNKYFQVSRSRFEVVNFLLEKSSTLKSKNKFVQQGCCQNNLGEMGLEIMQLQGNIRGCNFQPLGTQQKDGVLQT